MLSRTPIQSVSAFRLASRNVVSAASAASVARFQQRFASTKPEDERCVR